MWLVDEPGRSQKAHDLGQTGLVKGLQSLNEYKSGVEFDSKEQQQHVLLLMWVTQTVGALF